MTVAEFKKKWLRYKGKETSAYQEHFNDLCGILSEFLGRVEINHAGLAMYTGKRGRKKLGDMSWETLMNRLSK